MNLKSIFSLAFVITLGVTAAFAQSQTITFHNDLGFSVDVRAYGDNSTCTSELEFLANETILSNDEFTFDSRSISGQISTTKDRIGRLVLVDATSGDEVGICISTGSVVTTLGGNSYYLYFDDEGNETEVNVFLSSTQPEWW